MCFIKKGYYYFNRNSGESQGEQNVRRMICTGSWGNVTVSSGMNNPGKNEPLSFLCRKPDKSRLKSDSGRLNCLVQ